MGMNHDIDSIAAMTRVKCRTIEQIFQDYRNKDTASVTGSSAARVNMRNEIRGLMVEKGLPNFYIAINLADVHNPIVKFLAGSAIDVDSLLLGEEPNYWDQSVLVAKNPIVAAQLFNVYMKAFISVLQGFALGL
jgi:hypothetical protein